MPNQNPQQIARDQIDTALTLCGWKVQGKKEVNLHAGIGMAVREFQTDVGLADYVLFVDGYRFGKDIYCHHVHISFAEICEC